MEPVAAEGGMCGELLKRSEWLRVWNRRHVVVSHGLLAWYCAGKQTGSLSLDRGCCVTTSEDGRLIIVVQHSGREVQFRCDDRAYLHDWLRAVQTATRPPMPSAIGPSTVSGAVRSLPKIDFCFPVGSSDLPPESPPPPPQLLSKEAIGQMNWDKMVLRPTPISPHKSPSRGSTTASCPGSGSGSSLGHDSKDCRGTPKGLFPDEAAEPNALDARGSRHSSANSIQQVTGGS